MTGRITFLSSVKVLAFRVWGIVTRRRLEEDFQQELDSHLDLLTEENIRHGMTPEEARRAARVRLGGVTQLRETHRELNGLPWIETLVPDVRYALRMLRKNPGFTTVAVLTLALGIGANTALFSLIDAFLLRELPVKDPQQLVIMNRLTPKGGLRDDFPYPAFEQFRDRNHSFSGIFAWDGSTMSVTVNGQPEFVSGDFVSGSYFDVLGVHAHVGRTFAEDDDKPGRPPVAVISFSYWKRRFSQDTTVVGKSIYLAGTPFTVVGVMPPTFYGRNVAGRSADVMLPMFVHPWLGLKDHNTFEVMARLKPGVTTAQAQADLDVIYRQALEKAAGSHLAPPAEQDIRAQKIEFKPGSRGEGEPSDHFAVEMRILMCVVAVVLLIASVNVASLLLARAAGRQKEIAVRLAIGAGRARVSVQLFGESMLLAAMGGALGFLFAKWGVSSLVAVLSMGGASFSFALHPDPRILAFTAAVSLLTGVLLGLVPAFAASRVDLNPILKGAEAGSDLRSSRYSLGKSLVVSQVALSLALLIGAGLLIRTLRQVYTIDAGFDRAHVLFAWILPALNGYDHAKEMTLYRELLEKMNSIPGIQSATLARYRQFVARPEKDVWVQGSDAASRGIYARTFTGREVPAVYYNPVGPGFFRTMGIGQLLGRDFAPTDTETSPKVAIVSESMSRLFFPNQNPTGKRLGFNGPQSSGDVQIVGVVRDTRHHLLENASLAAVYIPYTQGAGDDYGQMNLVVRSQASTAAVIAALRQQGQSVDKNLPLSGIETPAADLDEYLGDHRSLATLLGFFGALAVLLASIGLYGTMSYTVGRRTKELGIRMTLGAQRRDAVWMVLRETLSLAVLGVAIGIPIAAGSERLLGSMLFGVKATDPLTIACAVLAMLATAALAGYLPARTATKVDPMVALRYE
jgi:predicted permease